MKHGEGFNINIPGLSAIKRIMTYPLAGMFTTSLRGGSTRLTPGTGPLIQVGSAHVPLEQSSFKHRMSGLKPVEFPVIESKGG